MIVKPKNQYQIRCNIIGDSAPTNTSYNPWRHRDKPVVNYAGVTITTVPLQDTIGIQSTIAFAKVARDQLGDYICSAGDGKPNDTKTLEADHGKWH